MKLLMVSNYFESHRGGLELVAGRLARELTRLGQHVVWIASATTPPPDDDELRGRTVAINVLNATERYLGIPFPLPSPAAIWRIGREVRRSDAVLLQDSLYPACIAAFLFARLFRRRILIAAHVGLVPYRNPIPRLLMVLADRFIARPMLARADRVAIVSEITARHFSQVRFRSTPELIFNGLDTEVFHPVAQSRRLELRSALGLEPDRPIALFVGRFVEKKGLPILAHMARIRPDIQWAFAGWGHLDPGGWGLPNVAVFRDLAGSSLAALYQASDVFVLPSKGEGFPLVIQEALACGLPVVCSAETAGADEAVAPFLSAVPLDETEPEATAAAFCAAIDRALAREDGGAAGERFRFVSERYSWTACAAKYMELIAALATAETPPAAAPRPAENGRRSKAAQT